MILYSAPTHKRLIEHPRAISRDRATHRCTRRRSRNRIVYLVPYCQKYIIGAEPVAIVLRNAAYQHWTMMFYEECEVKVEWEEGGGGELRIDRKLAEYLCRRDDNAVNHVPSAGWPQNPPMGSRHGEVIAAI